MHVVRDHGSLSDVHDAKRPLGVANDNARLVLAGLHEEDRVRDDKRRGVFAGLVRSVDHDAVRNCEPVGVRQDHLAVGNVQLRELVYVPRTAATKRRLDVLTGTMLRGKCTPPVDRSREFGFRRTGGVVVVEIRCPGQQLQVPRERGLVLGRGAVGVRSLNVAAVRLDVPVERRFVGTARKVLIDAGIGNNHVGTRHLCGRVVCRHVVLDADEGMVKNDIARMQNRRPPIAAEVERDVRTRSLQRERVPIHVDDATVAVETPAHAHPEHGRALHREMLDGGVRPRVRPRWTMPPQGPHAVKTRTTHVELGDGRFTQRAARVCRVLDGRGQHLERRAVRHRHLRGVTVVVLGVGAPGLLLHPTHEDAGLHVDLAREVRVVAAQAHRARAGLDDLRHVRSDHGRVDVGGRRDVGVAVVERQHAARERPPRGVVRVRHVRRQRRARRDCRQYKGNLFHRFQAPFLLRAPLSRRTDFTGSQFYLRVSYQIPAFSRKAKVAGQK